MDNSNFIQEIRKHISSGYKYFPANTPLLLDRVRCVIAKNTASPEHQAELVALEKELEELSPPSPPSFPGSSATSL